MDNRELWNVDGDTIVEMRRSRGWNRKALAQAARVSPHTVARMERGGAVFPQTVAVVAEVLEVPAEMLKRCDNPLQRLPRHERNVAERVLGIWQVYQHAAAASDFDLLHRDFYRGLHPHVVFSSVVFSNTPEVEKPFGGIFRGAPRVLDFAGRCIANLKREQVPTIEEIRCVDSRHVLLTMRDDAVLPALGAKAVATVTMLWSVADALSDPRIVAYHQTVNSPVLVPLENAAGDVSPRSP